MSAVLDDRLPDVDEELGVARRAVYGRGDLGHLHLGDICMCIYIYMYRSMYLFIYIYICIERERYIYIYIYRERERSTERERYTKATENDHVMRWLWAVSQSGDCCLTCVHSNSIT